MSKTTVYAELMREVAVFVKEHDLNVKYDPIDMEHPELWGFTIYNKSRSLAYRRLFSAYDLERCRIDPYHHANLILDDIRKKLKEKGVIM